MRLYPMTRVRRPAFRMRRPVARSPITTVQTYIPTHAQIHCAFSSLLYVGSVLHWYYRSGADHPASDKGVIKRRKSPDNGRTWMAEETVYSHASLDASEVESIVAPNGDILLLGYLSSFPAGTPQSALLLRSSDGGASFSAATFLPTDFSGAWGSVTYAVFYGKPRVHGTTITSDGYFLFSGTWWSCRFESTDSGATWAAVGSSQSGYNECQTIGDLTTMTRFLRNNSADVIYTQTTTNAGTSWTTPALFAFGVGPRMCQLANGDWLVSMGRRASPGATNLYRFPSAAGGLYASRRVQAVTFSGTITDCGYGAQVQALGEDHLVFAGYQALATGTYPSAAFVKLIPLASLERGAWSETAFADLGAIDYNTAIVSVSGGRLIINDNSGSLVFGAYTILNGGNTGSVTFEYDCTTNTDFTSIELFNLAGQAVFSLGHNPTGEWLQAWNGSAFVDPTTPVSIPLSTPTTIILNWNVTGGTCEVVVGGVSKGTVPIWSGRIGPIASLRFSGGSSGGTSANYAIDNFGQSA